MQSIDETGKPRYRAACDACRQSKVRCSGGGVCIRCKKHEYKCRYSIAHRAGKPKGSKNKATLKKLENLHAAQQGKLALGGGTAASIKKISRPLTSPELSQRKKRRSIPIRDIRVRYDLAHPAQMHMRNASHQMTRKYAFVNSMPPVYPSPTSPAEPQLSEGGIPLADMRPYDSLETMYGHIASPAMMPYLTSPDKEPSTVFHLQLDPSTVARVCDCIDRMDSSHRQLSGLDSSFTLWRFDPTMELVTASLLSCNIFLSCAACPKSGGGSLWLLISVLDRSFNILNHLVHHRTNRRTHELWSGQQQQQQQYNIVPFDYALALQDYILEQSIATSYQIICALRNVIDTEIRANGGVLGDISMHNHGLSSSSSSSLSSGFPSPVSMETPAQDFSLFRIKSEPTHNRECSALNNGKAKSSKNALSANEINFLFQAIHRYDTLIGNMQAVVTGCTAAATAHAHAHLASWSVGLSNTATNQCEGGVAPYQPATTIERFPQQPHPGHGARFPSYDVIGLS